MIVESLNPNLWACSGSFQSSETSSHMETRACLREDTCPDLEFPDRSLLASYAPRPRQVIGVQPQDTKKKKHQTPYVLGQVQTTLP